MASIDYTPVTNTKTTNASCTCPACRSLECLERPRFFAGQLLTEADLNSEQAYLLAKNRLHNRYLHGWGVVCGLEVVCHDCQGWVRVKAGYALDPCGNDIVVCGDRDFNVITQIQKCLDARRRTADDCEPWQDPNANCKEDEEQWCVTIAYQETETRGVMPLRQTTSKNGGCGCGGASTSSSTTKSGCGCGDAPAAATNTSRGAACEATRVLEQYRLDVVPRPKECAAAHGMPVTMPETQRISQSLHGGAALFGLSDASMLVSAFLPDAIRTNPWTNRLLASAPGSSLLGEVLATISEVSRFLGDRLDINDRTSLAAMFDGLVAAENGAVTAPGQPLTQPVVSPDVAPAADTADSMPEVARLTFGNGVGGTTTQSPYDLCCRFRRVLQDLYNQNPLKVRCAGFDCPPCVQETVTVGPDVGGWMFLNLSNSGTDATGRVITIPQNVAVFRCLIQALVDYVVDAVCLKLLPPCPAPPCDNRLILACVTVRNGKIVHICNFACRHYAGSFNALAYWTSAAPFTSLLTDAVRTICCAPQTLTAILGLRGPNPKTAGGGTVPPASNP